MWKSDINRTHGTKQFSSSSTGFLKPRTYVWVKTYKCPLMRQNAVLRCVCLFRKRFKCHINQISNWLLKHFCLIIQSGIKRLQCCNWNPLLKQQIEITITALCKLFIYAETSAYNIRIRYFILCLIEHWIVETVLLCPVPIGRLFRMNTKELFLGEWQTQSIVHVQYLLKNIKFWTAKQQMVYCSALLNIEFDYIAML